MNEYRIKAYPKINLGRDVVRRLENGYHEVKMVMQTVGIYDVLDFERTDGGIVITTDSGELPTDENNLIYKAAKLMMETYPISGGVKIHLEKHIPIAEMLKRIGRAARIDMEQNFGLKVNLKTWVKVKENWIDNPSIVDKFKLK